MVCDPTATCCCTFGCFFCFFFCIFGAKPLPCRRSARIGRVSPASSLLSRWAQGFVSQLAAFRSALSTQLSAPTVFGPANPVTGHSLGSLVPALVRLVRGSSCVSCVLVCLLATFRPGGDDPTTFDLRRAKKKLHFGVGDRLRGAPFTAREARNTNNNTNNTCRGENGR